MENEKSKKKLDEFKELTKPLIKWLNENYHPHAKIIIETGSAEVVEGSIGFPCAEYYKD